MKKYTPWILLLLVLMCAPVRAGFSGGGGAGAITQIAQVVADGSSGVITFSSIPGTYTNLRIVGQGRSDAAASNNVAVSIRLNADGGSHYFDEYQGVNAGSTAVGQDTSQTTLLGAAVPASTSTAHRASTLVIDIPNYAGTTFFKYASTVNTQENAEAFQSYTVSSRWESQSAITSATFTLASGNWVSGSTFTEYGIK